MLRNLFRVTGLLVLPLALLLFAQWPLRDAVQAGSREANDLAQLLFAIYMAVAMGAATHHGVHLAAAHAATHHAASSWRPWAIALCVVPWAVFVLVSAAPQVWQSIAQLERFGETLNPGYFVIKLSLMVMLVLVIAQAAIRPAPANTTE